MVVLLRDLLLVSRLGLSAILLPEEGSTELVWAHSSDLVDPSPFVEQGQLLLTTGQQFDSFTKQSEFDDYVRRIRTSGVAALGFGTEYHRDGTPLGLRLACEAHALPLVEVEHSTPFIAVSRWVVESKAEETRSRQEWALTAQNAVSLAAVGPAGIAGAVKRAAELLDVDIAVFSADAELITTSNAQAFWRGDSVGQNTIQGLGDERMPSAHPHPRKPFPSAGLIAEIRRMLRSRRRASLSVDVGGELLRVQTLGNSARLQGVLVVRALKTLDDIDKSVVTVVAVLVEVALQHRYDIRESLRTLFRELFGLLEDGHVGLVRRAMRDLPAGLPGQRFRVLTAYASSFSSEMLDALERRASEPSNRTFHIVREQLIVELVDEHRWSALRRYLRDNDARAGVSQTVGWDDLATGLAQAGRALEVAPQVGVLDFEDMVATRLLGLLSTSAVAKTAQARLAMLSEEARLMLPDAATWLRHNGQWDPAARELGTHRHRLKARIQRLGSLLDLDLDRFPDRAELWALITATNLDGPRQGAG